MDNITHSLVGWAIGQAGLKKKTRKGLAALILAANMPDIDVFFGHSCWLPLATHRGFTHSLLGGIVLMPPLLAGLLWLWDRWQMKRGVIFSSELAMSPGWLLGLCYIGALTHPLLDWQTSYAIQLLSPFSNHWFHAESLFIIDVWIWIALGLGIGFSYWRERRGRAWQRPAQIAIVLVLAYIMGNQMLTAYAKHALRTRPPYPEVESVFAQLEPLKFWTRGLVYREGGRGSGRNVAYAWWSPFASLHHTARPVPDNMADPLVRRAMEATPEIRRFMRWSVMPMAGLERGRCSAKVRFTDARFANMKLPLIARRNPFLHEAVLPLDGPGCRKGAG